MRISVFNDIETLAQQSSWMRARDPRAKILVAVFFVITVVSFPRTSVSAMLPLALLLVWWASCAQISFRWLFRKTIFPVTTLAVLGAANLFFEQETLLRLGNVAITQGIVSWVSIVLRATFSISMALLLVASTGVTELAAALLRLHAPREFVSILLLLYRYLFVLSEEASSMNTARLSRSFGKRGFEFPTASRMIGNLLLRALARAERIHAAMLARGFGHSSFGNLNFCWSLHDTVFLFVSIFLFTIVRLFPIVEIMGRLFQGALAA